jgi:hypothetical protein
VELVRALERLDHLARFENIYADGAICCLSWLGALWLFVAERSVGVDDVDDLLLRELFHAVVFLLGWMGMVVPSVECVAREVHLDVLWIHVARAHVAQVAEDMLQVLEDPRNVWHPTHLEVGVLRTATLGAKALESVATEVELEVLLLASICSLVRVRAKFFVHLNCLLVSELILKFLLITLIFEVFLIFVFLFLGHFVMLLILGRPC